MLLEILNVVSPILIITVIGYLLAVTRVQLHPATLSSIVILIATPALIFSALTSVDVSGQTVATMAFAAALTVAISAALGVIILKLAGMPIRTFLPSLCLPNSGNVGVPLAFLAFGQEGLALGVSFFFVVALIQHSAGFAIASGQFQPSYLLKQPLIYAIIAVFIVVGTGLHIPEVIASTTKILAGMMIPVMLILLGSSLATLKVSDLKPAAIVAVGRLGTGIISALIVIWALSLTGVAAGSVFLMATMSSAIITHVFAQRFSPNPEQVAGAVIVSTLLTFACLPLLLWAALQMAG